MFLRISHCKVPETHVIISAKLQEKLLFANSAGPWNCTYETTHFIGRKRRWGSGTQDIPSALDFIQSSVNPVLLGWFKTRCNLWAAPLNIAELLPWESQLLQTYSSNVCVDPGMCAGALSDSDCLRRVKQKQCYSEEDEGFRTLSLTVQQWHWEAIKYWEDVLDRQVKAAAGTISAQVLWCENIPHSQSVSHLSDSLLVLTSWKRLRCHIWHIYTMKMDDFNMN